MKKLVNIAKYCLGELYDDRGIGKIQIIFVKDQYILGYRDHKTLKFVEIFKTKNKNIMMVYLHGVRDALSGKIS